jgi:L-alanine-DL-glutamate epimerase-like enolase superfamily enzyme
MKITEVRTRVVQWEGKTKALPPHFCTNPMDQVMFREASMAEFFPRVDAEVGNELFWYIFDGEPEPVDGYIDLDENLPGLGLTVNEESMKQFRIVE